MDDQAAPESCDSLSNSNLRIINTNIDLQWNPIKVLQPLIKIWIRNVIIMTFSKRALKNKNVKIILLIYYTVLAFNTTSS